MSNPPLLVKGMSGQLYAHLLNGQLYWTVSIDCEPIEIDEEQWPCGVVCEWLTFPVRRWQELSGLGLAQSSRYEASFYLAEHHSLALTVLSLTQIESQSLFRLQLEGSFDLNGFGSLNGEGYPLSIDCLAQFSGIYVVPENVADRPSTPEAAGALLAKHFDISGLLFPVWDRFRFVFEPAGAPPNQSFKRTPNGAD